MVKINYNKRTTGCLFVVNNKSSIYYCNIPFICLNVVMYQEMCIYWNLLIQCVVLSSHSKKMIGLQIYIYS